MSKKKREKKPEAEIIDATTPKVDENEKIVKASTEAAESNILVPRSPESFHAKKYDSKKWAVIDEFGRTERVYEGEDAEENAKMYAKKLRGKSLAARSSLLI